ncbi:polyketide synthase dehydratase domain-containing protein, partial [Streptomyces albus]|uniref:polyketide synthase dehydratase domain-containing protein n=1 Tax=Streptomyces albus TaxID=1888 RepID=UPI0039EE6BA1
MFTGRISARSHPWLAEHRVAGDAVFPGTGYVELAVRAGDELACDRIEELVLEAPLVLPAEQAVQVQVLVDPADAAGSRSFRISSRTEGRQSWIRHASGVLAVGDGQEHAGLTAWPPAGAVPVVVDGHYAARAEGGFGYGAIYQGLTAVWRRDGELFAEVALGDEFRAEADRFGLHPAVLDAALQPLSYDERSAGARRLPFCWNGVTLHATGASLLRVAIVPGATGDSYALTVADTEGAPVLTAEALTLRPYDGSPLSAPATSETASGPPSETASGTASETASGTAS